MSQRYINIFKLGLIGFILTKSVFQNNFLKGQSILKIDTNLTVQSNSNPQTVLILLSKQADLSGAKLLKGKQAKAKFVFNELQKTAQSTQQELLKSLRNDQINHQSYYIVNMIKAEMSADQILSYAQKMEVKSLIADSPLIQEELIRLPEEKFTGSLRAPIWNLNTIGAPTVWEQGYKGQNIVIGGQDTGYAWEVETIKSKYRGWDGNNAHHDYNWHDAIHSQNPMTPEGNPCGFNSPTPCDDNNHGTHTMGTMIGDIDDNGNEIGVAPHAKWVGCRNMEEGYGTLTTYTECFQWFLAPYPIGGTTNQGIPDSMPHVINNSWGCPTIEGCNSSNWEVMRLAIENLKLAGCVVVVSAGNSGSKCNSVKDPAAIFGESYSVGATNSTNTIANFSSRGSVTVDGSNRIKPDISAPGVNIRSCLKDGSFTNYSGTSMAGPHVAGVVALMISANPALAGEVDKIQEIINHTAIHMTSSETCGGISGQNIPNNTFGFGIINAAAAVDMILPANYAPHVVCENSIVIDNHLKGIVLTNPLNQKVRIRINDDGEVLKESNPSIENNGIQIKEGSLKLTSAYENIILKSSNGKFWKLIVDNQGIFFTEEITALPINHILVQSGDLHIEKPKKGIIFQSPDNHLHAVNATTLNDILTIPIPN